MTAVEAVQLRFIEARIAGFVPPGLEFIPTGIHSNIFAFNWGSVEPTEVTTPLL